MRTDAEIKELFARYTDANVTKRGDGVWVVHGDMNFSRKGLNELPFKGIDYEVMGFFRCDDNQLITLNGGPRMVEGEFWCFSNLLTTLEGAPKVVTGCYDCRHNQLTTLEGSPRGVVGHFRCSDNQITSLEGSPQVVRGHFECCNNRLTRLEGAPREVSGNFWCENNNLTALNEAPQVVGGNFHVSYWDGNTIHSNPLLSLQGCPNQIGGDLHICNCYLTDFKGISNNIEGRILCSGNPFGLLDGLPEGYESKLCDFMGMPMTLNLLRNADIKHTGISF